MCQLLSGGVLIDDALNTRRSVERPLWALHDLNLVRHALVNMSSIDSIDMREVRICFGPVERGKVGETRLQTAGGQQGVLRGSVQWSDILLLLLLLLVACEGLRRRLYADLRRLLCSTNFTLVLLLLPNLRRSHILIGIEGQNSKLSNVVY